MALPWRKSGAFGTSFLTVPRNGIVAIAGRSGPSRVLWTRHYLHHACDIRQAAHTAASPGPWGRNSSDVHHRGCDILVLMTTLHSCAQLTGPSLWHISSGKEVAV